MNQGSDVTLMTGLVKARGRRSVGSSDRHSESMFVRNQGRCQGLVCSIFITDIARIKTGARESPIVASKSYWVREFAIKIIGARGRRDG